MPKLYIVPTPIGNLDDITLRAVKTLASADLILAEDTRTTAFLLKHLGIDKKLQSHHKFNEHAKVRMIAARIAAGDNVALVSDAGTPGISDPGFLLVRTCIEAGVEVETLPGATAFVPALIQSGFPCDRFCFEGFPPQKKGRAKRLQQLADEERTMIFYESPYRVVKLLGQLADVVGGGRQVSVSRELTKKFEETVRGTLDEAIAHFTKKEPKGEFVIVLAGSGAHKKPDVREEDDTSNVGDASADRPRNKRQARDGEGTSGRIGNKRQARDGEETSGRIGNKRQARDGEETFGRVSDKKQARDGEETSGRVGNKRQARDGEGTSGRIGNKRQARDGEGTSGRVSDKKQAHGK